MKDKLVNAIADMKEQEALALTEQMLKQDDNPQIILDACREAMSIVGKRYEEGEYFLPELIIAGDMLTDIGEIIKPKIKGDANDTETIGKVLIGTIAGDIHDIGKDIVTFMLDVNNFEVHDLGVDVPAERFVEAIKEFQPDVVGLSGFLTLAYEAMENTVKAIEDAGLRDSVKIMIGGSVMDNNVARTIGADAYGADAAAAVNLAKTWIGVE